MTLQRGGYGHLQHPTKQHRHRQRSNHTETEFEANGRNVLRYNFSASKVLPDGRGSALGKL